MNHRLLSLALCSLLTSCAGNGYISSSIITGVGLDVSGNSKSQVPHVRFGYIRSGLYYVPTGKSPGPPGSGSCTGQASETPDLVSEIMVDAHWLDSITIYERFAIGETAASTDAAQAAFRNTVPQQAAASSR